MASRRAVSLTPLIDVVFILLLFFMLATNFQQWRSLTLNAPGGDSTVTSIAPQAPLLRVHSDGTLSLSGQKMAHNAALAERLHTVLNHNPDQAVVVQPDPEVMLQTLVNVFDLLAASGVRRATLGEN